MLEHVLRQQGRLPVPLCLQAGPACVRAVGLGWGRSPGGAGSSLPAAAAPAASSACSPHAPSAAPRGSAPTPAQTASQACWYSTPASSRSSPAAFPASSPFWRRVRRDHPVCTRSLSRFSCQGVSNPSWFSWCSVGACIPLGCLVCEWLALCLDRLQHVPEPDSACQLLQEKRSDITGLQIGNLM